jgi:hypothetical protein
LNFLLALASERSKRNDEIIVAQILGNFSFFEKRNQKNGVNVPIAKRNNKMKWRFIKNSAKQDLF